jgi:hypothetical protein
VCQVKGCRHVHESCLANRWEIRWCRFGKASRRGFVTRITRDTLPPHAQHPLPFSLIMRRAPHSTTRVFEHVRRSVMRTPCAHEPPGNRQCNSRRRNGAETNSLHIHGRCLPLPFVSCRISVPSARFWFGIALFMPNMYVNCLNMNRISYIPGANDGHTV